MFSTDFNPTHLRGDEKKKKRKTFSNKQLVFKQSPNFHYRKTPIQLQSVADGKRYKTFLHYLLHIMKEG